MSIGELTPPRYYAWQKSVYVGTQLAEKHPRISEWYKKKDGLLKE